MKKKIFYIIVIPIALYALYVVSMLIYGTITDFQPKAKINLTPTIVNNKKLINPSDTLSFMTWNIGYGGLGNKSDFFVDGGQMVRPEESDCKDYIKGIENFVEANNDTDFILLQEVDVNSKRSYCTNILKRLQDKLPKYNSVFAPNYKVDFVPAPLTSTSPMGKVLSGLVSLSTFKSLENTRFQYPGKYNWPKRIFHLDRCLLYQKYELSNSKTLVVINSHNSAFDGGVLKAKEMKFLKDFVTAEYKKGNYVIVGADWNQCPPNFNFKKFRPTKVGKQFQENIKEDYLPGWTWAFDPETPTNRKMNIPYSDEAFTTLIDFYLLSPNVELIEVKTTNLDFKYSDHQPVKMKIRLK